MADPLYSASLAPALFVSHNAKIHAFGIRQNAEPMYNCHRLDRGGPSCLYLAAMKQLSRALSPLAPSLFSLAALSLMIGTAQAAAPAHKAAAAKPAATKPAPKAGNDIIPLPLNPILPASQRVCGTKTASGVSFTMLRPATGPVPAEEDYVLVNYIGYLAATGAVFDQGMHATFPVAGVIPGFSQGLQMVPKGGIARFCIPAAMGYGAQAAGPIPANSDLVFQVELIDYKTGAEIETMRKARAAATAPAETAPATTPAPNPAPAGTPQQ